MSKVLCNDDYVLFDKANNSVVRFGDGEIIIYGSYDEAAEDCYGNESVIRCTELPKEFQDELLTQINN